MATDTANQDADEAPILKVDGVIEVPVSADDVDRAAKFYARVFGFKTLFEEEDTLRALDVCGRQVILIFKRKAITEPSEAPEGEIPAHDVAGETHFALGVESDARLQECIQRLTQLGIAIESEARSTFGGRQLYFRDTENNLVELITRNVWPIY